MNRQDACSTKSEFSCGTGILPVAELTMYCYARQPVFKAAENLPGNSS